MRKLELVQSFSCKWNEVANAFAMVDYEKEMSTTKSVSLLNVDRVTICSSYSSVVVLFILFVSF